MSQELKKTKLYGWHRENKARIAPFGKYEMPLWYASAKEEHLNVLTKAGLFDTSHMDLLLIRGKQAKKVLQWSCSRDLEKCLKGNKNPLTPGYSVYTVILNEYGHVIDDAIISQLDGYSYLVVVNAGMGEEISNHFDQQRKNLQAEILNLDNTLVKIDLQGPKSGIILSKALLNPEQVMCKPFGFFSFKGNLDQSTYTPSPDIKLRNNVPLIISRSGYTGEFGFELFVSIDHLIDTWQLLFETGQGYKLIPCGLAARDSLRTGAVLPLSHQDIGAWPFLNNPWTFALPWNQNGTGFTKEFLGKDSLLHNTDQNFTFPFVGYDLRKINTEQGEVISQSEEKLGQILTCVTDMGIDWVDQSIYSITSPTKPKDFQAKGLSCGFIKVDRSVSYSKDLYLVDNRRSIKIRTVKDIRPDRTAREAFQHMIDNI